jgi:thioesterase domain-containing protein/acyl carrier protein
VSIGRPIANTQIYLLDRYLQPVPVGVPGEVHIGGDGLARGYLNRPELTAERFIPHPFSSELGARLYQTGDLARYLPDGTIECCGRIDHQVKIRGFRLEPGEIEAVLGQHVQEAVVLAREDIAGDKRLVAYVVPRQKPAASVQELRDALKAQLPDYMIPSAFVFLPSLPLTPNGKVDRRALPAPAQSTVEQERVIVAPRDELEHQLLQIWQDIFRRDALSVQDNFFELGGHSLLAVRMLAKIQQRLGKRLPLATLLQEATIAHLARLLRQQERPMPRSFVVAIQPHGTQPPFFCVHPASGHVYQYRELARLLGPDQPFYGIASPAVEKKGEIDLTIEAMAARYLEQIRLVQPKGPYFLGGYCMGGLIVFEIARLLHTQGQHVALLALVNTWGPASQLPFLPTLKKRLLDFLRRERQEQTVSLHKKQQRFRRTLLEFLLPALRDRELWRLQSLEKLNERIARAYVPQVYAGTLVFFRVQKQPAGIVPNPEREWVKLAAAGAEVYEIPGDHYSMFDSPNVPVLAACLRGCLQKAQQNCGLRIKFSAEQ